MVSFPVRTEVENSSTEKPGFTVTPLPVTTGDLSTLPMRLLPLDGLLFPAQERQGGQGSLQPSEFPQRCRFVQTQALQRKNGWWEGHGQDGAQHVSYHLKARAEEEKRTAAEEKKQQCAGEPAFLQGRVDEESSPHCVKAEKEGGQEEGHTVLPGLVMGGGITGISVVWICVPAVFFCCCYFLKP